MRRFASSGQFRTAAPLASVPLFERAIRAKSAPHCAGWVTRRANRSAYWAAHCATVRASIA